MKYILGSTIAILLILSNLYADRSDISDFKDWMKRYSRFYPKDQLIYREFIYNQNKLLIENHNMKSDSKYKMGENQFMDLTHEEFIEYYLSEVQYSNTYGNDETVTTLSAIDWRNSSTVQNQGACGAGWAFSLTSSMESWFYIRGGGQKISVSAQELIDCVQDSDGCNGGSNVEAMKYTIENGLTSTVQYPYAGFKQTCRNTKGLYFIDNYTFVGGSTSALQSALQNYPVSVGVDAANWQFYSSGTFSNCSNTTINHYALLVGFDSSGNWSVQSSFGDSWGENGFIKLSPNNTCGIFNAAYQIL